MRRMQIITEIFSTIPGTTSAHAENTGWFYQSPTRIWNYLRACGECKSSLKSSAPSQELPPRMRRIPAGFTNRQPEFGTTSVYAENTATLANAGLTTRNYLRARGEYSIDDTSTAIAMELPPRARRIRPPHAPRARAWGTTSACAENTPELEPHGAPLRNYLRVRGEYLNELGLL